MRQKTTQKEVIEHIKLKKDNVKIERYHKLTILTHAPCSVAIFEGRKAFPVDYFKYDSDSKRNDFINKRKDRMDKAIREEKVRLEKYESKKAQIKVGSILYSSWGYEQTNIDFYLVLERKNDTVIIQEIGKDKVFDPNFDDRGRCTADPDCKVGEPFRKRISKYASINLNSYASATLWDGRPLSWSSYH